MGGIHWACLTRCPSLALYFFPPFCSFAFSRLFATSFHSHLNPPPPSSLPFNPFIKQSTFASSPSPLCFYFAHSLSYLASSTQHTHCKTKDNMTNDLSSRQEDPVNGSTPDTTAATEATTTGLAPSSSSLDNHVTINKPSTPIPPQQPVPRPCSLKAQQPSSTTYRKHPPSVCLCISFPLSFSFSSSSPSPLSKTNLPTSIS